MDMSLSKAKEYLHSIMRINYKNEAVLVKVIVTNLSDNEDDFEAVCEMAVSEILRVNRTDTPRNPKDMGRIMNKLTDGQYILHSEFRKRLNCTVTAFRPCGDWKMLNKYINIEVEQENGEFHYELVGKKN